MLYYECIQRDNVSCENFSWKFPCYWNNLALAFCSPGSELWSLAPVTWPRPARLLGLISLPGPHLTPANVPIKKKHQTSLGISLWKTHTITGKFTQRLHTSLAYLFSLERKFSLSFIGTLSRFWGRMVKLQSLSAVSRAGPGGARRLPPVWPVLRGPGPGTCCCGPGPAWPRTAPAPRAQISRPECPGPAWAALGPRQVGLAGPCQGNCTKSKKERHDEYSWVFVNMFLGI